MHDEAHGARVFGRGVSVGHSEDPMADSCRQVLCAVLYRAMRDLELSDQRRAQRARRWLRSEAAAEMAELAGVATGEQLHAYVEERLA